MAYENEKQWVKEKIRKGHKISRSEPFYQTLKRAERNMKEVQAFMDANDVDSHTY